MKQLRIFSILMAVLLMASCNKGDDQASGTGDVIIVAKQSGSTTLYGISIYAYTLSAFTSVTAVSDADPGKTYTLKSDQGFKTSFYFETPEGEFTTSKPAASTYNFSAMFENGVSQKFEDILTDAVLPIPSFEQCAYNEALHRLELEWPLINGANSYAVNILDGSKIVFKSIELKIIEQGTFFVRADGGGWEPSFTPESGKTYTVRLFAYMHEPGGGGLHIQSISIADRPVVWGD